MKNFLNFKKIENISQKQSENNTSKKKYSSVIKYVANLLDGEMTVIPFFMPNLVNYLNKTEM